MTPPAAGSESARALFRYSAMAASSVIRGAWYRPDLKELELLLWSGRRYLYTHVPSEVAERFANAESKGGFYNRWIRNCFPCRELMPRRKVG